MKGLKNSAFFGLKRASERLKSLLQELMKLASSPKFAQQLSREDRSRTFLRKAKLNAILWAKIAQRDSNLRTLIASSTEFAQPVDQLFCFDNSYKPRILRTVRD
jgi:hypothetical protein